MKVIFRKKLILKHSKRKIIYIGGRNGQYMLPKDLNKEASLISKILNINAF